MLFFICLEGSIPRHRKLSSLTRTSHNPLAIGTPAKENTSELKKDERIGNGHVNCVDPILSSNIIAAIVTSLGGTPGAVGIVRLLAPSSVSIVRKLFQPKSRKKRFWLYSSSLGYFKPSSVSGALYRKSPCLRKNCSPLLSRPSSIEHVLHQGLLHRTPHRLT